MRVYISNIHWMGGTAIKAQNTVTDIAKRDLHYDELVIVRYPVDSDSPEMLGARLDGILGAVCREEDIVVLQLPTWNDLRFDETLIDKLKKYKKIFFIHDVPPLMFYGNGYLLKKYISIYNQADVIIVASQKLADCLRSEGLTVEKIVVQRMWDSLVSIDQTVIPQYKKVINFAGRVDRDKFAFTRDWNFNNVQLVITTDKGDWAQGKNIGFLGWFSNDDLLANALRTSGGFGLLWSEDSHWREYMRMNASYKLSTYLAAGIPVIVPEGIAEQDTILHKNLGIVVKSLEEAVEQVDNISVEQYKKMAEDVGMFSELLRGGYFAKKVLTDAVFKLLND